MAIKTFWRSLFLVLALGAVAASGASASGITETALWRTGSGSGTVLSGSATVVTSLGSEGATLESEVGTTPLKLKFTGVECISCTIFNEGEAAVGAGKLKFTGATVVTPTTCAVEGGAIATNALSIDATWMSGTQWAQQFKPASGTTVATLKLIKGSGACPISGSYLLSGTQYSIASNLTGVLASTQLFRMSLTNNIALSGALTLNSKPVGLSAGLVVGLTIGLPFGAHH
jgi:hypothetical protein